MRAIWLPARTMLRTSSGASIGGKAMPFLSTSASLTAASWVGPWYCGIFCVECVEEAPPTDPGLDGADSAPAGPASPTHSTQKIPQ